MSFLSELDYQEVYRMKADLVYEGKAKRYIRQKEDLENLFFPIKMMQQNLMERRMNPLKEKENLIILSQP